MSYDEAIHLLINHASLARDIPDERCLSVLLHWLTEGKGDLGIDAALREVLKCLKVVNCELNGKVPSEVIWQDKSSAIPRDLVYAVASLIARTTSDWEEIRNSTSSENADRELLASVMLTLNIAWDAVLAGDIDDLDQHIHFQRLSLGLTD